MGNDQSILDRKIYKSMPKIDLHRHLEGAIRFETLIELDRQDENKILDEEAFKRTIRIGKSDVFSHENFLAKFQPMRRFYKFPKAIKRFVSEAVEDAAADNIIYLELRFSPSTLCNGNLHDSRDVLRWVTESAKEASTRFGIETRLITSLIRHEPVERAAEIGEAAQEFQDQGIIGIDLAGDEANYSALPFLPIFERAQRAGLRVTLHAGEWNGAENILQAIEKFKAERIGHGVRVLEDDNSTRLAREHGTTFEVCITSNYHSGVVASLKQHPIKKMLAANLNVTINSDDPQISQITLTDEIKLLSDQFGLTIDQIRALSCNAVNAAFINPAEKKVLLNKFNFEFDLWKENYFQYISS
jgi:adenosine deaminase